MLACTCKSILDGWTWLDKYGSQISQQCDNKAWCRTAKDLKEEKMGYKWKKFPGLYSVISSFEVANEKVNSLDSVKKSWNIL